MNFKEYRKKRLSVLVISNSKFTSGAEKSLLELLNRINAEFEFIYTSPKSSINNLQEHMVEYKLPYVWFSRTSNPLKYVLYIISIIISTILLIRIVNRHKIDIIYANTVKSSVYGICLKVFTNTKLLCHIRDNFNYRIIKRILVQKSDIIIGISEYIFKQIPQSFINKRLVYGGIDVEFWKHTAKANSVIKNKSKTTIIQIACIGQLTSWKNQFDFIKAARIISDQYDNANFFIVGDNLSGRERKYKKKLKKIVNDLDLQSKLAFLGDRSDIREILNQIDVLIHPAINEPFGRVIIEAMAMEKPVIAYNCGGPEEIIIDGETGYLAEPYNYNQLAERTIKLIEEKDLRLNMGRAGRQRVVEKFNIRRYVSEMEDVFDNI